MLSKIRGQIPYSNSLKKKSKTKQTKKNPDKIVENETKQNVPAPLPAFN